MANITGWGRGTWGQLTWGEPIPVELTGLAGTSAISSLTITARACMIFNETATGDPAVAVFDFGGDKTSTAGSFTITFPTADASNAVIRIA